MPTNNQEKWEKDNTLLDVENLSSRFHQVYEKELERQGKKSKHPKMYFELSEEVKDLDRALAKYVIEFVIPNVIRQEIRQAKIEGMERARELGWKHISLDDKYFDEAINLEISNLKNNDNTTEN